MQQKNLPQLINALKELSRLAVALEERSIIAKDVQRTAFEIQSVHGGMARHQICEIAVATGLDSMRGIFKREEPASPPSPEQTVFNELNAVLEKLNLRIHAKAVQLPNIKK